MSAFLSPLSSFRAFSPALNGRLALASLVLPTPCATEMLLLSILLIVLASLPLSETSQCYEGVEWTSSPEKNKKEKVDCKSGYCTFTTEYLMYKGGRDSWSCVPIGEECKTEAGVHKVEDDPNVMFSTVCCKGELCNETKESARAAKPPQPVAVECYAGIELMEDAPPGYVNKKEKKVCASGACELLEGRSLDGTRVKKIIRGCDEAGPNCIMGCQVGKIYEDRVTVCCCKDALCNDSNATALGQQPADANSKSAATKGNPAAPLTALLSFAAVAASIAARI